MCPDRAPGLCVQRPHSHFLICRIEYLVLAAEALRLFTGITSAEGYRKLTEHLGPDKKV
jgi:hypothetical protein